MAKERLHRCVNRSGENYKTQIQKELEKSVRMTFHKLPLDPVKRKRWLDALSITEPRQKRPVVCSLHFEENAFDRTSLVCVRLREGATPRVIIFKFPINQRMRES